MVGENKKIKIPREREILYGLKDVLPGSEGHDLHVDQSLTMKYQELVNNYISDSKLIENIKTAKSKLGPESTVEEMQKIINMKEYVKMIEMLRDRGLERRFYSWMQTEKGKEGFGINSIELNNVGVRLEDVFDPSAGAVIKSMAQTQEMGRGMGGISIEDEYLVEIENEGKGIKCKLKW